MLAPTVLLTAHVSTCWFANRAWHGRYVAGIRHEVERVDRQLHLFNDTLDEWLACQKDWMYLKSIFSAPDIQRQLPHEAKSFTAVDKQFKDTMRRTRERSNAMQAATVPGLRFFVLGLGLNSNEEGDCVSSDIYSVENISSAVLNKSCLVAILRAPIVLVF